MLMQKDHGGKRRLERGIIGSVVNFDLSVCWPFVLLVGLQVHAAVISARARSSSDRYVLSSLDRPPSVSVQFVHLSRLPGGRHAFVHNRLLNPKDEYNFPS